MMSAFSALLFFAGASIGSFINAAVWRMREGLSIIHGRSQCTVCAYRLTAFDLIPIVSFFILQKKCRSCQSPISWRYPVVELVTAALFVVVGVYHQSGGLITVLLVRDIVIMSLLVFIFMYDVLYQEILNRVTILPALILVPLALLYDWLSWQSLILGVLVGGGFFYLQYVLSRGRWIGGGDIRLGMFMGVVLGFPGVVVALFFAYVIGAICSIALLLLRRATLQAETPFGTYLAIGTGVALLWGADLVTWYAGLVNW